ncbi:UPF0545 protein C22orf39 homolog isoform X4 [Ochotona princeps]|uniref:UPF0545 protein C22orf39 homolog isoform X4 n=1 Tax=Ochotona princeps TaxID=9978 RepID=UPI002714543A|nr:UPF0545 protein C22orf39 homolog isoform X4 [Ochotona princeps]
MADGGGGGAGAGGGAGGAGGGAGSGGGGGWQPPRSCEAYRAEWKLCRSARHFLHHYYVHGERPTCEQWRRDLARCRDWEKHGSLEAQVREARPCLTPDAPSRGRAESPTPVTLR